MCTWHTFTIPRQLAIKKCMQNRRLLGENLQIRIPTHKQIFIVSVILVCTQVICGNDIKFIHCVRVGISE